MDDKTKLLIGTHIRHMASTNSKQPVSLLQEALATHGFSPKYSLVQTTGPDHSRNFTYQAYITDEIYVYGTAGSKKEAKFESARNLIKLLISYDNCDANSLPSTSTSETSILSIPPINSPVPTSDQLNLSNGNKSIRTVVSAVDISDLTDAMMHVNLSENYIGKLQEHCTKHAMHLPVYIEEGATGMSHMREFTTSCNVGEWKAVGVASTKKDAKKMAAQKMWHFISRNEPVDTSTAPSMNQIPIINLPLKTNYAPAIPETKEATSSKSEVKPENKEIQWRAVLEDIQESLNESSGPDMLKLKVIGILKDTNHLTTLRDLCQEEALEMAITHLEDRTADDRYQCMILLRFPPLGGATSHMFFSTVGEGEDFALAELDAARRALELLKSMAALTKFKFVDV